MWEAGRKDDTKHCFGPRPYRRGLPGQADRQDEAWTLREIGHGDTLEEKDQEALDNCFDMSQGKAEAMREYINREEMMSL